MLERLLEGERKTVSWKVREECVYERLAEDRLQLAFSIVLPEKILEVKEGRNEDDETKPLRPSFEREASAGGND
jgi:hypothetical protein